MTTPPAVVIVSNMNAQLMLSERHILADNAFVEAVVWRVPAPVSGSRHDFKSRLALVVDGRCVLRHDNESGKGDHKHVGDAETPYAFTTPAALLDDFWADVNSWRS